MSCILIHAVVGIVNNDVTCCGSVNIHEYTRDQYPTCRLSDSHCNVHYPILLCEQQYDLSSDQTEFSRLRTKFSVLVLVSVFIGLESPYYVRQYEILHCSENSKLYIKCQSLCSKYLTVNAPLVRYLGLIVIDEVYLTCEFVTSFVRFTLG